MAGHSRGHVQQLLLGQLDRLGVAGGAGRQQQHRAAGPDARGTGRGGRQRSRRGLQGAEADRVGQVDQHPGTAGNAGRGQRVRSPPDQLAQLPVTQRPAGRGLLGETALSVLCCSPGHQRGEAAWRHPVIGHGLSVPARAERPG
ncbi:MAG TPA: hypothetical protein VGD68_15920 [Streptosporangiaceae bacterium]